MNVGFLNIHGARKQNKWEELYRNLDAENVCLFAVTETHLRGLEAPPVHPDWHWLGRNRHGEGRKGGGIGFLWRKGSSWEEIPCACSEHLWVSGNLIDVPTAVGVVYLTVTRGHHEGNAEVMRCIADEVHRWADSKEVLLIGDFNGHIQPLDGFQDSNGELLLQTADALDLKVLNLRADCEGEFTWCARNNRSCIDYALASGGLAQRVTRMHIDEEGAFSVGSDHNRIKLTLSKSLYRRAACSRREPTRKYVPPASYESIAAEFEESCSHMQLETYDMYVGELRRIMCKYEARTHGHARRNRWWDDEVRAALQARREANRRHRQAVGSLPEEACRQTWDEYLVRKRTMQRLVQRKIAEHDDKQLREIVISGRNGPRKFWQYVSSLDRKPITPVLRDARTGDPVPNLVEHLTSHIRGLYEHLPLDPSAEPPVPQSPQSREEANLPEPPISNSQEEPTVAWEVTRPAIDRALAALETRTAQGLDSLPAGLVKSLGETARERLAKIFTGVIRGDPIPEDWLRGKVTLIPKRDGDKSLLRNHRPLTVTSVLYRVFAQVVKRWMNGWAENSGRLTELQNGFRHGRRLEDNLFVLTECIEIARKESRGLVACFLDVAKAYDSVPHDGLLRCMTDIGMPLEWVDLLRRLYSQNTVVAFFAGVHSEPVSVDRGLKQGCPLSPLLYMLYAAGLEHVLLESGHGFQFRYTQQGLPDAWTLPGLVFADDLVLLAENTCELQQLVSISAEHIDSLGLQFNPSKSAVVRFSGTSESVCPVTLPSGETIAQASEYRYLGVILSGSTGTYTLHEEHLRNSSKRASCILRRRCLWGCNRYLLVRELWKTVHVPALTFGNAVVLVSAPTRAWLERGQREVGRLALGCHGRVAVEAIQGDMGWSSFEAREACSKLGYEGRLRRMDASRWAQRVYRYLHFKGIRTIWYGRVNLLRRKFGFLARLASEETETKDNAAIQARVREEETTKWALSMQDKSTLRLYRTHKANISKEKLYDNSIGSVLLFEARAGALRTLTYRRHFDTADEVQAEICRACGNAQETIEHLVLYCPCLRPPPTEGTTLPTALGFSTEQDGSAATREASQINAVAATKARLQSWWQVVQR